MMNTDAVQFDFIFLKKDISKLVVVGVCTFVGFVLGFWAGRPKTTVTSYDKEIEQHSDTVNKSTLSDEDRDYIN
ncbi:LapA family protein [Pedobacter sp. ok626]|uniref:LapA family protein n=1 Tax=Pedobacter sp. ok626 TaxID=1761882 RepID=UPI0020C86C30|nr:LapA family protein [Pedobacter sp. ok626]